MTKELKEQEDNKADLEARLKQIKQQNERLQISESNLK